MDMVEKGGVQMNLQKILHVFDESTQPLETEEIKIILKEGTRMKILSRLNILRRNGVIKGKSVGSGKGTWIWWKKEVSL